MGGFVEAKEKIEQKSKLSKEAWILPKQHKPKLFDELKSEGVSEDVFYDPGKLPNLPKQFKPEDIWVVSCCVPESKMGPYAFKWAVEVSVGFSATLDVADKPPLADDDDLPIQMLRPGAPRSSSSFDSLPGLPSPDGPARQLKRETSEEHRTEEKDAFERIADNCARLSSMGKLYHANAMHSENVWYWLKCFKRELLFRKKIYMADNKGTTDAEFAKLLPDHIVAFPKFVCKCLLENDSWPVLENFITEFKLIEKELPGSLGAFAKTFSDMVAQKWKWSIETAPADEMLKPAQVHMLTQSKFYKGFCKAAAQVIVYRRGINPMVASHYDGPNH